MRIRTKFRRPSFTLIEMTIVIAIIGILAAMAMSVYATALSQSKVHRTRAIIAKIDQIIGEKWEGYRTRQVPIRILPNTPPGTAAAFRLNAMRELQRMEMPDRITDVANGPAYGPIPSASYPASALVALSTRPVLNKQYLRRAVQARDPNPPYNTGIEYWTQSHENSECLYLILAATRDGDKSALDYFAPSEIGDTDNDNMNEILDGWGRPIAFLRWPAGYRADVAPFPVTPQSAADPDPFDPFKIDARLRDAGTANDTFALKPLIFSAGGDRFYDVNVGPANVYNSSTVPPNDPYVSNGVIGLPSDTNADGDLSYSDNITNHDLEAR